MFDHKLMVILCFLTVFAAHSINAAKIPTQELRQTAGGVGNYYQVDRYGRYIMRYETPNGIIHFETGYLRYTASGIPYQVKEGYYMYPTADGKMVRVAYFADHEGYRVLSYDIRSEGFEEVEYEQALAGTITSSEVQKNICHDFWNSEILQSGNTAFDKYLR